MEFKEDFIAKLKSDRGLPLDTYYEQEKELQQFRKELANKDQ